jgi:hypothetical protein
MFSFCIFGKIFLKIMYLSKLDVIKYRNQREIKINVGHTTKFCAAALLILDGANVLVHLTTLYQPTDYKVFNGRIMVNDE